MEPQLTVTATRALLERLRDAENALALSQEREKAANASLEGAQHRFRDELRRIMDKYAQLKGENDSMATRLADAEQRALTLASQVDAKDEHLRQAAAQTAQLSHTLEITRGEVSTLRAAAEAAAARSAQSSALPANHSNGSPAPRKGDAAPAPPSHDTPNSSASMPGPGSARRGADPAHLIHLPSLKSFALFSRSHDDAASTGGEPAPSGSEEGVLSVSSAALRARIRELRTSLIAVQVENRRLTTLAASMQRLAMNNMAVSEHAVSAAQSSRENATSSDANMARRFPALASLLRSHSEGGDDSVSQGASEEGGSDGPALPADAETVSTLTVALATACVERDAYKETVRNTLSHTVEVEQALDEARMALEEARDPTSPAAGLSRARSSAHTPRSVASSMYTRGDASSDANALRDRVVSLSSQLDMATHAHVLAETRAATAVDTCAAVTRALEVMTRERDDLSRALAAARGEADSALHAHTHTRDLRVQLDESVRDHAHMRVKVLHARGHAVARGARIVRMALLRAKWRVWTRACDAARAADRVAAITRLCDRVFDFNIRSVLQHAWRAWRAWICSRAAARRILTRVSNAQLRTHIRAWSRAAIVATVKSNTAASIDAARDAVEAATARAADAETHALSCERALADARVRVRVCEDEIGAAASEAKRAGDELRRLQAALAVAETSAAAARSRALEADTSATQLRVALDDVTRARVAAEASIATLRLEAVERMDLVERATDTVAQLRESVATLTARIAAADATITQLQADGAAQRVRADASDAALHAMTARQETAVAAAASESARAAELSRQLSLAMDTTASLERSRDALQVELARTRDALTACDAARMEALSRGDALETAKHAAEVARNEIATREDNLRTQYAAMTVKLARTETDVEVLRSTLNEERTRAQDAHVRSVAATTRAEAAEAHVRECIESLTLAHEQAAGARDDAHSQAIAAATTRSDVAALTRERDALRVRVRECEVQLADALGVQAELVHTRARVTALEDTQTSLRAELERARVTELAAREREVSAHATSAALHEKYTAAAVNVAEITHALERARSDAERMREDAARAVAAAQAQLSEVEAAATAGSREAAAAISAAAADAAALRVERDNAARELAALAAQVGVCERELDIVRQEVVAMRVRAESAESARDAAASECASLRVTLSVCESERMSADDRSRIQTMLETAARLNTRADSLAAELELTRITAVSAVTSPVAGGAQSFSPPADASVVSPVVVCDGVAHDLTHASTSLLRTLCMRLNSERTHTHMQLMAARLRVHTLEARGAASRPVSPTGMRAHAAMTPDRPFLPSGTPDLHVHASSGVDVSIPLALTEEDIAAVREEILRLHASVVERDQDRARLCEDVSSLQLQLSAALRSNEDALAQAAAHTRAQDHAVIQANARLQAHEAALAQADARVRAHEEALLQANARVRAQEDALGQADIRARANEEALIQARARAQTLAESLAEVQGAYAHAVAAEEASARVAAAATTTAHGLQTRARAAEQGLAEIQARLEVSRIDAHAQTWVAAADAAMQTATRGGIRTVADMSATYVNVPALPSSPMSTQTSPRAMPVSAATRTQTEAAMTMSTASQTLAAPASAAAEAQTDAASRAAAHAQTDAASRASEYVQTDVQPVVVAHEDHSRVVAAVHELTNALDDARTRARSQEEMMAAIRERAAVLETTVTSLRAHVEAVTRAHEAAEAQAHAYAVQLTSLRAAVANDADRSGAEASAAVARAMTAEARLSRTQVELASCLAQVEQLAAALAAEREASSIRDSRILELEVACAKLELQLRDSKATSADRERALRAELGALRDSMLGVGVLSPGSTSVADELDAVLQDAQRAVALARRARQSTGSGVSSPIVASPAGTPPRGVGDGAVPPLPPMLGGSGAAQQGRVHLGSLHGSPAGTGSPY